MTIIFDGKKFADEKESVLLQKVSDLKVKPKLVSILVGEDKASVLYTKLKQKAAKRIGAEFIIKDLQSSALPSEIIGLINELNGDTAVHGIMVQLPLPKKLQAKTNQIVNSIDKEKDVDGLSKKTIFVPAAAKAVSAILAFATKDLPYIGKKAAVVGAKGAVGVAVVRELQKMGFKVTECDINTRDLYAKLTGVDVVVSATGVPKLIKGELIKEGVIAIDVGSPEGDFDPSVKLRASFITPVPGGVGPVTIVSLLENLIVAVYNQKR